MGWLDAWLADLGEPAPIAKPKPQPRTPKPEIKSLWFQTRTPAGGSDLGEVAAGFYSVSQGILRIHDEDGRTTGKEHRLLPDEDERKIAGRLARAVWEKAHSNSDFNRPLHYSSRGIV